MSMELGHTLRKCSVVSMELGHTLSKCSVVSMELGHTLNIKVFCNEPGIRYIHVLRINLKPNFINHI